jgi:hypothetical protein
MSDKHRQNKANKVHQTYQCWWMPSIQHPQDPTKSRAFCTPSITLHWLG